MSQMDIKILTKDDKFLKSVEFNYEELKAWIESNLEKYENLVYTDETIKEAKADRTTLNKFGEALNNERKEIKKKCLVPYAKFEKKIKELGALVDIPKNKIDAQVKAYEERLRQKKHEAIKAIWKQTESSVKNLVNLDRVFDSRWLNMTYSMNKIEEEIKAFFATTETEISTIEELNTEFEDQVIRVYLETFSIAAALAENKSLLEQKAKREAYAEEQRLKKEAEEKARQEAAAAQPEPKPEPVQRSAPPEQETQCHPVEVQRKPEIVTVDFRVTATREQLQNLKAFLINSGITFGPVPSETKKAA
ncbi:DUF1351 domain-containing protein [Maridesulfovibrio bastinii]|uniref:DUF1351 domain-containing protein n=1 Tax=Maridesulfovibrio bastinii TaxID=47157 RepID=UPI000428A750|nr:DUF1351 domain-containing protein [Maridesulfovibrio bastinii]